MPCKSNYKKFQVAHYWPVPIYSQENVDVKMVHTRASQLVSFKWVTGSWGTKSLCLRETEQSELSSWFPASIHPRNNIILYVGHWCEIGWGPQITPKASFGYYGLSRTSQALPFPVMIFPDCITYVHIYLPGLWRLWVYL